MFAAVDLPEHGQVGIMCITDKQFGNIELFYGKKSLDSYITAGDGLSSRNTYLYYDVLY